MNKNGNNKNNDKTKTKHVEVVVPAVLPLPSPPPLLETAIATTHTTAPAAAVALMTGPDLTEEIFKCGLALYRKETLLIKTRGYAQLQYKKFVEDKIVKQFSNTIITKEKIRHILGEKSGHRLYKHDKQYSTNFQNTRQKMNKNKNNKMNKTKTKHVVEVVVPAVLPLPSPPLLETAIATTHTTAPTAGPDMMEEILTGGLRLYLHAKKAKAFTAVSSKVATNDDRSNVSKNKNKNKNKEEENGGDTAVAGVVAGGSGATKKTTKARREEMDPESTPANTTPMLPATTEEEGSTTPSSSSVVGIDPGRSSTQLRGEKRGPYKPYKKREKKIKWCNLPPCRDNETMETIKKAAREHALYGPSKTKKRVPKIPLTEEQKKINHNKSSSKSYCKRKNDQKNSTNSIGKEGTQHWNDTAMLEKPREADTTTTTTTTTVHSTTVQPDTSKPVSSNEFCCGTGGENPNNARIAVVGAGVDDTAEVAIGARIGIWWDGDTTYYPCTVRNKRGGSKHKHKNMKEEKQEWFIEYDDGAFEWLDLATEQVCWIKDDDTSTIANDDNTSNTITIDDADNDDAVEQEWAKIRSKVHTELKTTKQKKQNSSNMDRNGGSTNKTSKASGKKGYYKNQSGTFRAQIYCFGKLRTIGTFPNEEDASLAYAIAKNKIKLFGLSKATQAEKDWKLIRMDVIHYIDKTPVKFLKNLHFAVPTAKGYTKTKTGKFQAHMSFKGKTRAIGTFKDEWMAKLAYKLARYKIDEGILPTIPSEESSLARSTTTTTSVGDTNQGRTVALATAPMIGSMVKDTIKSSSCNNGRKICGEATRSAAFVGTNFVENNEVRRDKKEEKQKTWTKPLADSYSENMTQNPRETMIEFGATNEKHNARTTKKMINRTVPAIKTYIGRYKDKVLHDVKYHKNSDDVDDNATATAKSTVVIAVASPKNTAVAVTIPTTTVVTNDNSSNVKEVTTTTAVSLDAAAIKDDLHLLQMTSSEEEQEQEEERKGASAKKKRKKNNIGRGRITSTTNVMANTATSISRAKAVVVDPAAAPSSVTKDQNNTNNNTAMIVVNGTINNNEEIMKVSRDNNDNDNDDITSRVLQSMITLSKDASSSSSRAMTSMNRMMMGKIRIEKKITMIGNEDDDIVLQALIQGHCDFVRRLRKEAQQQEQQQQQQNSDNSNMSYNRNVVTVFDTVAQESRSKSKAPKEGAKKRKQIMYDEEEAALVSVSTKRLRKEAVVNDTTKLTKQPIAPSSPSGGNTDVGAEEKEEKYYSVKKSAQIVPMTPRRQEAKTTTAYHLHRGSEKQQGGLVPQRNQQRRSSRQTVVKKKRNADRSVHLLSGRRKRNKRERGTVNNNCRILQRKAPSSMQRGYDLATGKKKHKKNGNGTRTNNKYLVANDSLNTNNEKSKVSDPLRLLPRTMRQSRRRREETPSNHDDPYYKDWLVVGNWTWIQHSNTMHGASSVGNGTTNPTTTATIVQQKKWKRNQRILAPQISDDGEKEEKQWMVVFERLVEYRSEHNHTLVPQPFALDRELGVWVATQRAGYNHGTLLKARYQKLTSIQFVWNAESTNVSKDERWFRMYQRLLRYQQKYRTTHVYRDYREEDEEKHDTNQNLGYWVHAQRHLKKKNKLLHERYQLLESIKFIWEGDDTTTIASSSSIVFEGDDNGKDEELNNEDENNAHTLLAATTREFMFANQILDYIVHDQYVYSMPSVDEDDRQSATTSITSASASTSANSCTSRIETESNVRKRKRKRTTDASNKEAASSGMLQNNLMTTCGGDNGSSRSSSSAKNFESTKKFKAATDDDDATNYDSDGDFRSWNKIGNWCWLVAGSQKKSSKVTVADNQKMLQLGERKSIRVAVKNSRGDEYNNQNGETKTKQTLVMHSHRKSKKPTTAIRSPRSEDVLVVSGRSKTCYHPGNLFYKSLIKEQLSLYAKCTDKAQKHHIEALIFGRIKSKNGRFLKKEFTGSELWEEISDDEALKKVRRSLDRLRYTATATTIRNPCSEDVLLVAGRSNHPGNLFYKSLVEEQFPQHAKTTDTQRQHEIEVLILGRIKSKHGRFLKKRAAGSELWKEISDDEALKKVGATLYRLRYSKTPKNQNNIADVYKKATEEAHSYMLKKYGQEYVDKHRDKEIVAV